MVVTRRHQRHVGAQNKSGKSLENLTLLLCKTWAIICYCFVYQHGHLISWLKTIYTQEGCTEIESEHQLSNGSLTGLFSLFILSHFTWILELSTKWYQYSLKEMKIWLSFKTGCSQCIVCPTRKIETRKNHYPHPLRCRSPLLPAAPLRTNLHGSNFVIKKYRWLRNFIFLVGWGCWRNLKWLQASGE